MSYFLSELIPTTGLVASYPCVDVTTATRIATIADYSGNGRDLAATGTATSGSSGSPIGELSTLNGYPTVLHAGEKPLLYAPTPVVKELYILTKYDGAANFGATYRGLVSGETSSGLDLVGDGSGTSTKFFDYTPLVYNYYKSHTSYATSNAQAPFSNFELVELSYASDMNWDGIQVGQHKTDTARRWLGRWADLHVYSSQLSTNERRRIRLYYDLKYLLWRTNSTTLEFPDPTLTGIYWNHFKARPLEWDEVTDTFEYEDAGRDFNERTDTPPQRWDITFTGLSYGQMEIFDTFNKVARRSRTFSLVDKWGVTQTGVRIESYSSSHRDHKSWANEVTFSLVKYP